MYMGVCVCVRMCSHFDVGAFGHKRSIGNTYSNVTIVSIVLLDKNDPTNQYYLNYPSLDRYFLFMVCTHRTFGTDSIFDLYNKTDFQMCSLIVVVLPLAVPSIGHHTVCSMGLLGSLLFIIYFHECN